MSNFAVFFSILHLIMYLLPIIQQYSWLFGPKALKFVVI